MIEHLSERLISWASILEEKTREQAITTSSMPFIYPHVALMPDAHLGKGATVGSVIPTLGAIIPAAVGVDIGCGMIARRTNVTVSQIEGFDLRALRESIEDAVPLSPGKYNSDIYSARTEERLQRLEYAWPDWGDPRHYAENWDLQLGSLGGGNHFIEVSADQDGYLWLFLHSGSRGVGNKIAQHHIKVARDLMARYFIDLPDPDLAYLVEDTNEFWTYIEELRWAQEFARLNREEMMDRVEGVFDCWLGGSGFPALEITQTVNCHHNFTQKERHFGKDVWVSRKGAIDASEGKPGLIPGSMGTASYVVVGKGNRLALNSSPHGAGRNYSRTAARKTFTHDELRKAMQGIEWNDSEAFLDEIPAAYKDIDVVMQDASDLVSVVHTLRQIVNVKGA